MAVVIKFNNASLAYVLKSPGGHVGSYLTRKAVIITAGASKQAGSKTGALKRSIGWSYAIKAAGPSIEIGSSLPIAYLHHEGTLPHFIIARRRRYLRFRSKGVTVHSRAVKHPGTKPNRYLTDNLRLLR